jgi:dsDNA-specific endonuclease/ATPase MutS2
MQERASKLAVAEAELEEDRKSLDKRESLTTNMEKLLGRQRDSLKKQKESAEKRKAELEEWSREVEVAKAALDTRVHEAVQEAIQKLQEDQRTGASESLTGRPKRA